ncbi:aminotransferase, partial [Streptomyces sp. NPDC005568]
HSGIVTFRHARVPAAVLRRRLADRSILVGKIVADESPLYLPRRGIITAVRVSVSHDNTPGDIALFASALYDAIAQGYSQTPSEQRTAPTLRSLAALRAPSMLRVVPDPPTVRAPIAACVPAPSSVSPRHIRLRPA